MTIIFIVRDSESVYIMIVNLYRFRFNRENIDLIPSIVYLFCGDYPIPLPLPKNDFSTMLIIHYNFGTAIKFMQTWN